MRIISSSALFTSFLKNIIFILPVICKIILSFKNFKGTLVSVILYTILFRDFLKISWHFLFIITNSASGFILPSSLYISELSKGISFSFFLT